MWKKYRRKIVKREESSLTDVLRSRSLTLCQRRICRERIDFSLLFCMSTSLANGGAAQGTMGLPEEKIKQLCLDAGFSSVRLVPLKKSNHNLYEARA